MICLGLHMFTHVNRETFKFYGVAPCQFTFKVCLISMKNICSILLCLCDFLTPLLARLLDLFTHAVKLGVQLSSKYSMGCVL